MATATARKAARNGKAEVVDSQAAPDSQAATIDVRAVPLPTPDSQAAPDLQSALRDGSQAAPPDLSGLAGAGANIPTPIDMEGTVRSILGALQACIVRQTSSYVRAYMERGAFVADLIDAKLSAARNREQRDTFRAEAMRAAELSSIVVVDRASEPKPNPDRWLTTYRLCALVPNAVNLPSVATADKIATICIERDKVADSWYAPETWRVKTGYVDRIGAIVERAVNDRLSANAIEAMIDDMNGVASEPPKAAKDTDPVKAAQSAAKTVADKFRSQAVDFQTYFDALAPWLHKAGWVKAE